MTPRAYLDAVRKRCEKAICADCGGVGEFGAQRTMRRHACETCGGHEDSVGRGIVDDASAVRVMTDDLPKLERIARLAEDYREAQLEEDCFSPTVLQAKAALFAALEELK